MTIQEFKDKIKVKDVENNRTYLYIRVDSVKYGQSYQNSVQTQEDMKNSFVMTYYPMTIENPTIKYLDVMMFNSVLGGDETEVALWKSKKNICEYNDGTENCDTSGHFYGTGDSREPKFCARHFYQIVVSGDGVSNYKLEDIKEK